MKLITAIVRMDDLPRVMNAATDAGARGLTASKVSGFGQQYGYTRKAAPAGQPVLLPKARADIVVRDEDTDAVLNAIVKCVNTGSVGDGKLWVSPVDCVVRARTGERDDDAV
ncbi:MAG TPA: P-II family nitrogen regulator [Streptosporangiaceae bacterium]|nr:P-II family nitrogen regulator [Streptosporangiaceae bacterium]